MKPLCLNETFRLAEYGLAALSLFLNSILFLLILLKTKRELQVYSRVLLSNCVTETLFTLCSVLVEYVSLASPRDPLPPLSGIEHEMCGFIVVRGGCSQLRFTGRSHPSVTLARSLNDDANLSRSFEIVAR